MNDDEQSIDFCVEYGIDKNFDDSRALAELLYHEVCYTNCHWYEKEWPKEAQEIISIYVNCGDVFAWGCADSEDLKDTELKNLWQMWNKDHYYGPMVWACIQRNEMPQKSVAEAIRKNCTEWNIDELGLRPNYYDAAVAEAWKKQNEPTT